MPQRCLAEIADDFAAGRATPQELHDAFLSATVFCEAGDRPGFVAVGPPGDGFIPVFSSEAELVRARGPVKWFSTTGADLFGLVPDGYDLILDSAGPAPLRLNPSAVQGTAAREADRRLTASFAQDPPTPAGLDALISRVGGDRYWAYIDHPFPSDTDDDVQALLDAYLRADPEGRAYILEHLMLDPAESVACYADRLAVVAVRAGSTASLRLGLLAVGLAVGRVDYPDVHYGMSKLDHSARLLGVDLADFVASVAELLPEEGRTFIEGWLTRDDRGPKLIRSMGFAAQGSGADFTYVSCSPYDDEEE